MSDVGMERFYRSALNEVADVVFGGAAPGVFGAGRKSDEELAAELYRAGEELHVGDSVRHGADEATVVSIEQGDGPFDEPRVRLSSGLGIGARCVEKAGGE